MPGYTVVPNNLALLWNWYIMASHGTVDTSSPVHNLTDWHHWNQTWIAAQSVAGTYTIILKCVNTNAALTADWSVSGLGLVKANCDGATVSFWSLSSDTNDATNNIGTATSRASFALDGSIGNPNMLYSISSVSAPAWYVKITNGGSPFTLKLGNVVLGQAFDLGYPERPESISMQSVGGLQTETGVSLQGRIVDPVVSKSLVFTDPTYMTKAALYDRTGVSASTATYNTLFRHFAYAKGLGHAGGYPTYTGITAGAGVPCLYHEGTNNGLSAAGRPAFYGNWSVSLDRNKFRNISELRVNITDVSPRGSDVVPTTN